MNFFQRILSGRLFFKKKNHEIREDLPTEEISLKDAVTKEPITESIDPKEENKIKKIPSKVQKVEMPDSVINFIFMDNTYVLEAFELNFGQELNSKGQPGGLPRGGIMTITMSDTPDYYINEWMLREELLRDGLVRILPNKGKVDEGAELTISFRDAYCIRYLKKIDTSGSGLLTTIVVSPRSVKVGNEELENNWKRQESLSHYIRST